MTPEQWQRVFALVKASHEQPESGWPSFLDESCGGDAEVRTAAQSLLLAQKEMGSFLERPNPGLTATPQQTERVADESNPDASCINSTLPSAGKESHQLQQGSTVGRYVVVSLLGTGGMGMVYLAYDPELDRKVAIKLLHPEASSFLLGTDGRAWLLREAQAMARLWHPNVVSVYDVGRFEDQVFVAMEFVDGRTLSHWLREKPRSWREVLGVFKEAGKGLAAAHSAGIVHRDFKPGNVLVSKEEAIKVTDFGLAYTPSISSDQRPGTPGKSPGIARSPGGVAGTLGYIAPEQLRGETPDARADQYSFCVALYEALIGEHPGEGSTLSNLSSQLEAKHAANEMLEVPTGSSVPGWVLRPVIRGLSSDPTNRFESLDALMKSLQDQSLLEWMFIATRQ